MTPTPTPTPSPRASPAVPAPPAPTQRGWVAQRRPLAIVLFSVIACGLLVAAASVVPLAGKSRHASGLEGETVEPAAYAMKATGEISQLATLPALPEGDLGGLGAADAASVAALQQDLDGALAELEAALAAAAATMPTVPEDYVPGADVDVDLPVAQGYPLPSLPVPDVGIGSLRLQAVSVSDSPVGTQAGSPLDSLLGQLEGLDGQLGGLLGGSPLDGVLAGGLPVGPQGGSAPPQVQEADDAVDPDEAGALAASSHAQSALDLTTSSYESTVADLQALLDFYDRLADLVEEAIAQVHALQDKAEADVHGELEQRLDAIQDEVKGLEAKAAGVVALHAKAVSDAKGLADDAIAQATAAQSSALTAAGESALDGLEGKIASVQADATGRKQAIADLVQKASADLGTSADAMQALQAVQAAAAAATVQVDHDAKAQVAALQAQADDVRGLVDDSKASLQGVADDALAQVDAAAKDALAGDSDVRSFLEAQALSYGALMEARETTMATEAVAELKDLADKDSQAILDDAMEATRGTGASLAKAGDQVSQVQKALLGQVGKDLEYVAKVSDDYSKVPTDDRKARAEHWSSVALELDGVLEQALSQGRAIQALATQAMAAAHQAEGEVSTLG